MTTFLLIRHGETDAVGRSIMGWKPGWHLNPQGRRQAEALAARLAQRPIRAIYTSPLERAVETAEIVAWPHGIEPRRDVEFGEVRFGAWEGLEMSQLEQIPEWRRYNEFRSGTQPAGGEWMFDVQSRVVRRLQCLTREHVDETVAVVSHGDPLRAALAFYLGIPLDMLLRFEISPASLSVLELADWGARVTCMNATEAI